MKIGGGKKLKKKAEAFSSLSLGTYCEYFFKLI